RCAEAEVDDLDRGGGAVSVDVAPAGRASALGHAGSAEPVRARFPAVRGLLEQILDRPRVSLGEQSVQMAHLCVALIVALRAGGDDTGDYVVRTAAARPWIQPSTSGPKYSPRADSSAPIAAAEPGGSARSGGRRRLLRADGTAARRVAWAASPELPHPRVPHLL